jgi:hypothetical protein
MARPVQKRWGDKRSHPDTRKTKETIMKTHQTQRHALCRNLVLAAALGLCLLPARAPAATLHYSASAVQACDLENESGSTEGYWKIYGSFENIGPSYLYLRCAVRTLAPASISHVKIKVRTTEPHKVVSARLCFRHIYADPFDLWDTHCGSTASTIMGATPGVHYVTVYPPAGTYVNSYIPELRVNLPGTDSKWSTSAIENLRVYKK